jgi:AraC family transcriptional regulator
MMKKYLILAMVLATFAAASAIEVTYVDLPKMQAVAIRVVDYTGMGEAFGKLGSWAGPQGLLSSKTWFLSIYHANMFTIPEKPTPMDCAITVEGNVKPGEGMTLQEIGGSKYAKYTYKGAYSGLGKAWHDLLTEVMKNPAYTTADKPSLEVYLNHPGQVKPEELVTEFYLPVEPK